MSKKNIKNEAIERCLFLIHSDSSNQDDFLSFVGWRYIKKYFPKSNIVVKIFRDKDIISPFFWAKRFSVCHFYSKSNGWILPLRDGDGISIFEYDYIVILKNYIIPSTRWTKDITNRLKGGQSIVALDNFIVIPSNCFSFLKKIKSQHEDEDIDIFSLNDINIMYDYRSINNMLPNFYGDFYEDNRTCFIDISKYIMSDSFEDVSKKTKNVKVLNLGYEDQDYANGNCALKILKESCKVFSILN